MAAAERDALKRQGGEVYARIVEDLRQSAVTTDELASIAGVHGRQVQNWAAGRNKPKVRTVTTCSSCTISSSACATSTSPRASKSGCTAGTATWVASARSTCC